MTDAFICDAIRAPVGRYGGGLPVLVPGATINRLCGSGLDAVGTAAHAGACHLMIAGGVELTQVSPQQKRSGPVIMNIDKHLRPDTRAVLHQRGGRSAPWTMRIGGGPGLALILKRV